MAIHTFYEVRDEGGAIWGGESASDCVNFWLHNQPTDTSVWVSQWEGEGEDIWQVKEATDITSLAIALLIVRKGRV